MKVIEILKAKGRGVVTVRPEETIKVLSHRLRMERIGSVVVSSEGQTVDGIVSERDIVHGLAEHGAELLNKPVSELMTKSVITCTSDDTISALMNLMTQKRVRHLPVVEGKKLVGIISIGDVVKYRLDEIELEAIVMRDYAIASR